MKISNYDVRVLWSEVRLYGARGTQSPRQSIGLASERIVGTKVINDEIKPNAWGTLGRSMKRVSVGEAKKFQESFHLCLNNS